MANPFPGMDPYLEGDLWTSFQVSLVSEFTRQLAPKLRSEGLFVASRRRDIDAPPDKIELGDWATVPDVIVRNGRALPVAVKHDPVPQGYIDLIDIDSRRVVTAIEVLSPVNKRGVGRPEYVRERERRLHGHVNLLEIDLIRVGNRFRPESTPAPYRVLLHRADSRRKFEIWPVAMEGRLPIVPVPLRAGEVDSALDIQAALDSICDIIGFDGLLDYRRPPTVPFTPEQEAWADGVLRAAGKRP